MPSVVFVSDAGTPNVSDPGRHLAARCLSLGIPISPIPGPSAVAAAASVAPFDMSRYTFEGFPPRRGPARAALVSALLRRDRPTALFESPRRVVSLLEAISAAAAAAGSPAPLVLLALDLTKRTERVLCGPSDRLLSDHAAGRWADAGECTLIVAPAGVPAER